MASDILMEEKAVQSDATAVRAEIKRIVSLVSRIDIQELEDDVLIREELGVDSLMAMEIVARCEKALGIHIDEAKLFDVQTVGDYVALIQSLLELKS